MAANHKQPGESKAISRGKNSTAGCLTIFFLIFLIAGCFFFYLFSIRPILRALGASDWSETPCRILTSELESHQSDDGVTYSIAITYSYEVHDVSHTGDQYSFVDFSSSGTTGKRNVLAAYPVGATRSCFVNPDDPTEAVLNREITGSMFIGSFALIFIVIGLVGGLFSCGVLKWKSKTGAGRAKDWIPDHSHRSEKKTSTYGTFESREGPITLRPNTTKMQQVVIILFVALFWNGIVSIFVYQVMESFQRGRPEWFLTVFMIPFVVVGLGLLVLFVHQLLSSFNPRPTLTLNRQTIALGHDLDLSWKFEGNTNSIRGLKITLVGREEAEYRRGTNRYTDKETFAEIVLKESTDFFEITSGEVHFTVPVDSMHSFEADHNRIVWQLQFRGDIAWWPDVSQEYKLVILPRDVDDSDTSWSMQLES